MKQIHIAHLYYDLLNLYGENGNIKALKKELENQGVEVSIHFLSLDDDLDLDKYDVIYIGAGTEDNQKLVIPHLMQYQKEIKNAIKNGKFFIITGNAVNLFGKYIEYPDIKVNTIGAFKYHIKQEDFRMIDESIFSSSFLDKPVIGFQNQSVVMLDNNKPMFEVIKGIGSFPKAKTEGVLDKHFYGTYLVGPVLARNPHLLKYIVTELLNSKYKNFRFKDFDLKQNKEAYDQFVRTFYQNII